MSKRKSFYGFCSTLVLCLLVTGCNEIKEIPVYIHDTTHVVKEMHDSTYIDRWHTVYQKGDTIYITDEVTKIVTKIMRDTTYKYVEKPVEVSHVKEVEKPLTKWQSFKIDSFWCVAIALICIILFSARNVIRKLINR